ncbi:MAG: family N-acetyltransferase [Subtercola sp.]|nr:family N-acetyltransferase [Subtercola sp.]
MPVEHTLSSANTALAGATPTNGARGGGAAARDNACAAAHGYRGGMTVTVRRMPDDELGGWLDTSDSLYEAERLANGDSPEQAAAKARESRARYFPDGRMVEPHVVLQVMADGAPVGVLWIGPLDDERPQEWWVFDVDIDQKHRGKGYGRAAMQLAEVVARERGAVKLGLNVFGTNTVAQQLYRSLDYTTTAITMWKPLTL